MSNIEKLKWVKYPVLDQGFICLVDAMGDDSSIVQAARTSFGNDEIQPKTIECYGCQRDWGHGYCGVCQGTGYLPNPLYGVFSEKDRTLIRYLIRHHHTTPFEMVEIKFLVQVPMDCWRQRIRHRTASVNEYSTRYAEAIDMYQTTAPTEWRLQATDNKQGSDGFLTQWNDDICGMESYNIPQIGSESWADFVKMYPTPGDYLTASEEYSNNSATQVYQERLKMGVAKEQARKDLPLSTYTRAYWKCDLHNIFNFLRLRMDSHAQLEVRSYANAMFEIVKQIVPVACEAFEDYVLNGCRMSSMELDLIREISKYISPSSKPDKMSDREWTEFKKKVGVK